MKPAVINMIVRLGPPLPILFSVIILYRGRVPTNSCHNQASYKTRIIMYCFDCLLV
jgi:hypothetical protein